MRFENVFWDERAFKPEDQLPSILAIGDSWFWYPFPGGSLINQLGRLVKHKEHNILAVGQNGAEAYDYAFGKHEPAVRRALKMHGDALMAVFISGGGNDFAGFNDLRPLLEKNCSGATNAAQCFGGQPGGELYRLMDKIERAYTTLIGQIIVACKHPVKIYVHNYDYAHPTGKGVFGDSSWLKAALVDAQVPPQLQDSCIAYVLDQFTDRLKAIETRNAGTVYLVDGRGTLQGNDWANELHPTPAGFKKLAEVRWAPIFVQSQLT